MTASPRAQALKPEQLRLKYFLLTQIMKEVAH